jgi:hypothetical protein
VSYEPVQFYSFLHFMSRSPKSNFSTPFLVGFSGEKPKKNEKIEFSQVNLLLYRILVQIQTKLLPPPPHGSCIFPSRRCSAAALHSPAARWQALPAAATRFCPMTAFSVARARF